jgi:hypothetical protein
MLNYRRVISDLFQGTFTWHFSAMRSLPQPWDVYMEMPGLFFTSSSMDGKSFLQKAEAYISLFPIVRIQ